MSGFSRVALVVSGLFNVSIGLFLAFFSVQPSPHLALASHARLPYIAYVFKAHGFLVAQLGLLELFCAFVLVHPMAYSAAAFIVAIGDIYFGVNVYTTIKDVSFVPHPDEAEFQFVSVVWALGELLVMLVVLAINMRRAQPQMKSKK